jgi:hypothetical protein
MNSKPALPGRDSSFLPLRSISAWKINPLIKKISRSKEIVKGNIADLNIEGRVCGHSATLV